ncbi:hypothetical protein AB6A40_004687 [Gnathostoma spinigerum]|uniref:Uncharacterized protein n=1 Tax=Gnathostoma spinigerum TaxID=75299 RepID=A0ABD6ED82_9BILA
MVVECAMGETNEIRVPDVPLASLEDDIDSTKSHPSAATSDCENNVGDTNIDDDFNGEDNMSGSLEDLVGTFDQKITQIFKDMGETTEEMAPVQVRTQDEIMAESKIWWTLTGNLGNMTPLDYAKTEARQLQIPALNLNPRKVF